MKRFFIISSVTAAILMMSGCSSKMNNEDYEIFVDKRVNNFKPDMAKKKIARDEIITHRNWIDLSTDRRLSSILRDLSRLENLSYFIKNSEVDDIVVPSSNNSDVLKINNFDSLRRYIEDTTNYTIRIVKNRYRSDRPQIIEIYDKKSLNTDLSKVPFIIEGKSTISDALKEISKLTKFSIVYKFDVESSSVNISNPSPSIKNKLDTNKIYYNGDNVANFLKYISKMYNLFVDINYDEKIITISKYKTQQYSLIPMNYTIDMKDAEILQSDTGGENSSGGATTENQLTVKSSTKINILEDLVKNITNILSNDPNSKFVVDKSTGQVTVKTTYENMKIVDKIIDRFNDIYKKQLEITVSLYEFALNKDYNFGIDLDIQTNYIESSSSFVTKYLQDVIFKNTSQIDGENGSITTSVNSNNEFIRFSKVYSYNNVFTNNIPNAINLTNNRDYLKNINTNIVANNATTTTTSTEIGTIVEGTVITILPRIVGNKIFVKSEMKINKLNALNHTQVGDNIIYLPDLQTQTIPSTVIMNNGDRRIIGAYQVYEDVNNYNGVAPIEDFVIGGASGKKYVRKEIIVVIEAKRRETSKFN